MNWEAIGAIGEIIGAAAVVLTLGYLAVQIRQNTRVVRLSAFQTTTDRQHQWFVELARDPEVARVYSAGLVDPNSLNENERTRFDALVLMQMRNWEDVFLHHRRALVEDEVWAARYSGIKIFVKEPGMIWVWKRRKLMFTPVFREFMEQEFKMASCGDETA